MTLVTVPEIKKTVPALALTLLLAWSSAYARTIRPDELTPDLIRKVHRGELKEINVAFQQGDHLPLTFRAAGDLIESAVPAGGEITVKRTFFVKVTESLYLFSLDGKDYRPFRELLKGELSASAAAEEGSQIATEIALGLNVNVK